ncbi:MAG: ABC transporter permease subunit [Akkermansiaceae bacterium]
MKLLSKIKYPLLKLIDISGFKVLDPVVRLAYKEEPQKQIRDIILYMILPIIFILFCILIWNWAGPNHKTKSGEVPTPAKVWVAFKESWRFDQRENEKEEAFEMTGVDREKALIYVTGELAKLEERAASLQRESDIVAGEVKEEMDDRIEPVQARLDALKATIKEAKALRKEEIAAYSEGLIAGQRTSDSLVELIEKQHVIADTEKAELKVVNDELNLIRDNPPERLKNAQLAANKMADEVQHYKKRIDYLTTGNREVKVEALEDKAAMAAAGLASATTAADAAKEAKSVVSNTERAISTADQKYPRAATIIWQTWRSIATVFVGFIIAAAVAIPVGIMCGLNRVVMACLTPIISIFRPVSPVVWLLIFQIVVGAFFPDPETHPLFMFMNSPNNPLAFLQTNPAMIFSACTVAMCALWPALVNTALGVSAIDKDHLNVAKVLRLGFWSRLFKIIIPSSLPLMFAGLRISLGVGWMVLIAAEALSSSDGLGKFVWDEYQNGSSQSFANIILACFVVGIIGFFLDRLMIILQRLVSFDDGSATA